MVLSGVIDEEDQDEAIDALFQADGQWRAHRPARLPEKPLVRAGEWPMPRMLSCKEASRLCSAALDRPLNLRERLTLRMHLMMSSSCTNFHQQMALLRRITARFAAGEFSALQPTGPQPPDEAA